jgi:hypothetical protein
MGFVDWIGLAHDRYRWRALVNSVMNLRILWNAAKLPSGCTTCGFSSGTQLTILLSVRESAFVYVIEISEIWGFTALTTENAVFWDIKTQFLPHWRHITSPLQSPAGYYNVKFEVFTAVTMKNDASEERIASIIRMTIGEIGTTLAVTSNRKTLR